MEIIEHTQFYQELDNPYQDKEETNLEDASVKVKDSEILEITNDDKVTDGIDFDAQEIETKPSKRTTRNVGFKSNDSD